MQKMSGFTIVEIIIVCVVLGILASVIGFGWNGTLVAGRDRMRETEQKDWARRFETYRQRFNAYPAANLAGTAALTGSYCLGVDFPSNRCIRSTGTPFETASTSSTSPSSLPDILQQLAKIGTLPEYKHVAGRGGFVGPWVQFISGTPGTIRIYHAYESATCPGETTQDTNSPYSGGTVCYIQFTKN